MIQLDNVSKYYHCNGEKLLVVKNISMTVNKGELVSIIGRSGSGKSTLLNLIGCLDTVSAGEISINNINVAQMNSNGMASLRSQQIGFVFQSFNLIARNNAMKNVEMPMIYQGIKKSERKKRCEDILNKLNMLDRKKHYPNQLSGGQQQRIAIARALVNEPNLILADEPTGALDVKNADEIMKIFRSLTDENKTVVIVTHDREIAKQSDRVFQMNDGQLLEV
ncbi:MAG: putative ABC transport system ATP-binding protein [Alteromonadaceae bacterium]|jgi:putative ABC transport system ATP-binding protein